MTWAVGHTLKPYVWWIRDGYKFSDTPSIEKWSTILLPLGLAWPSWLLANAQDMVGVIPRGFHYKGLCGFCLLRDHGGHCAGEATCRCSTRQCQLRPAFQPSCQGTGQCVKLSWTPQTGPLTSWTPLSDPCQCHMEQKDYLVKTCPDSWLTKSWDVIKQML